MTVSRSADYLGLHLSSPIIIGSCSLTRNPETVRELAIAGAGAIVLPSLFQEQIELPAAGEGRQGNSQEAGGKQEEGESRSYDPSEDIYNGGPDDYVDLIASLKATTGVPVIASLNGCSGGDWLKMAQRLENAGAAAIEASLESHTTDFKLSANEIEHELVETVRQLCALVNIPVSIKLTPFHTNINNLAWGIHNAGAKGIVCFGHEPTWEIELDHIRATPKWALTPASQINPTVSGLLRIRSQGPSISVAASGGISSIEDVIAAVIAGADVVMITSEIYRSGPDIVAHLMDGLLGYLNRHAFESFESFSSSRPQLDSSIRRMQLGCLTRSHMYKDPTPNRYARTGDRWGHLE